MLLFRQSEDKPYRCRCGRQQVIGAIGQESDAQDNLAVTTSALTKIFSRLPHLHFSLGHWLSPRSLGAFVTRGDKALETHRAGDRSRSPGQKQHRQKENKRSMILNEMRTVKLQTHKEELLPTKHPPLARPIQLFVFVALWGFLQQQHLVPWVLMNR